MFNFNQKGTVKDGQDGQVVKVLRQVTAVLRQVFYSDQDFLSRWHAEGNEPFAGPLAKIRAALAELFAAASAEMGDSTRWPASRGL